MKEPPHTRGLHVFEAPRAHLHQAGIVSAELASAEPREIAVTTTGSSQARISGGPAREIAVTTNPSASRPAKRPLARWDQPNCRFPGGAPRNTTHAWRAPCARTQAGDAANPHPAGLPPPTCPSTRPEPAQNEPPRRHNGWGYATTRPEPARNVPAPPPGRPGLEEARP